MGLVPADFVKTLISTTNWAERKAAAMANTTSTARTCCCTASDWSHHVPAADHHPAPRWRRRRAALEHRGGQLHVEGMHLLLASAWPAPPAQRREYPRSMGSKCRVSRRVVSGARIFSDVYLNKLQKKFFFCNLFNLCEKNPDLCEKNPDFCDTQRSAGAPAIP